MARCPPRATKRGLVATLTESVAPVAPEVPAEPDVPLEPEEPAAPLEPLEAPGTGGSRPVPDDDELDVPEHAARSVHNQTSATRRVPTIPSTSLREMRL
jgi:hypothetical protein